MALEKVFISGASRKQVMAPAAQTMLNTEMAFGEMPEAQRTLASARAQAVLRDFNSRRGP
jgi:hypothetical protein